MSIVTANDTSGAIYFADGTTGSEQYRGGIGYTHSTDKLFLVSGGQTRAWMDTNGNVGIGTDNPSRQLDVEGVIRFSSNSNQTVNGYGEIYTTYSYGKGQIFIAPEAVTSPTNFHPNGGVTIGPANTSPPANGLIVSGNVGIGTTSPDTNLEVEFPSLSCSTCSL